MSGHHSRTASLLWAMRNLSGKNKNLSSSVGDSRHSPCLCALSHVDEDRGRCSSFRRQKKSGSCRLGVCHRNLYISWLSHFFSLLLAGLIFFFRYYHVLISFFLYCLFWSFLPWLYFFSYLTLRLIPSYPMESLKHCFW